MKIKILILTSICLVYLNSCFYKAFDATKYGKSDGSINDQLELIAENKVSKIRLKTIDGRNFVFKYVQKTDSPGNYIGITPDHFDLTSGSNSISIAIHADSILEIERDMRLVNALVIASTCFISLVIADLIIDPQPF